MKIRRLLAVLSAALLAAAPLVPVIGTAQADGLSVPPMPAGNTDLAGQPEGNDPDNIAHWETPVRIEARAPKTSYVDFGSLKGIDGGDTYVLKMTFRVTEQAGGVYSGPELLLRTGADGTEYRAKFQANCSYLFRGEENCAATTQADAVYALNEEFTVAAVVSPDRADIFMNGKQILGYVGKDDDAYRGGSPAFRVFGGSARVFVSAYSAYDTADRSIPKRPADSPELATGVHPVKDDPGHFATWEDPLRIVRDCGENRLVFDGFTGLTNRDSYVLRATFRVTQLSQWNDRWSGPEIVLRGDRDGTYYQITCQADQTYFQRFSPEGAQVCQNSGIFYHLDEEFTVAAVVTAQGAEIWLNGTKALTYDGSADSAWLRGAPRFEIGGQTSMLAYGFSAYDLRQRSDSVTVIPADGGTVTIDDPLATAGDTVTLTVQPDEGKALRMGSLLVLAGGKKIRPERQGRRTDRQDGVYTFTMPDTGTAQIAAAFVDAGTADFASLGAQYHTADGKTDGLRFGFALAYDTASGTLTHQGKTYTVCEYGALITTRAVLDAVRGEMPEGDCLTVDAAWGERADERKQIPAAAVLDISGSYAEYACAVEGLDPAKDDVIYSARGYAVLADGEGGTVTLYAPIKNFSLRGIKKAEGFSLSVPSSAVLGLPQGVTDASRCHDGSRARLSRVMQKARSGQKITIAFIGGSITDGTNVNVENSYARLVRNWWLTAFPNTAVEYVNAGIGQTGSFFGVGRVDEDVLSHDPDFVVVEYAVNDGTDQETKEAYESLLRKILGAGSAPALLALHMGRPGGSAQQMHEAVATHYDLPQVSYRDAVLRGIADEVFAWKDLTDDTVHPNVYGYAVCAALVNGYLQDVYAQMDALSGPDAPLPAPLTGDIYRDIVRLGSAKFTPDAAGDFTATADATYFLKDGWRCSTPGGAPFTFTVKARRIVIAYRRDMSIPRSTADVFVNDRLVTSLDGRFTGWDGQIVHTATVADSAEAQTFTVQIGQQAGSTGEFVIAAIYVAY